MKYANSTSFYEELVRLTYIDLLKFRFNNILFSRLLIDFSLTLPKTNTFTMAGNLF